MSIGGRYVSPRYIKLKSLASLFHLHLALALAKAADVEKKIEEKLEQMQLNYIREALLAAKHNNRSSIMGDDIRLGENHIDSTNVNPVNLLYFFAEEQFVGAIECFQFVVDGKLFIDSSFNILFVHLLNRFVCIN